MTYLRDLRTKGWWWQRKPLKPLPILCVRDMSSGANVCWVEETPTSPFRGWFKRTFNLHKKTFYNYCVCRCSSCQTWRVQGWFCMSCYDYCSVRWAHPK